MPAGLNSEFLSRDVLESLGFASLGEDVLIHSTAVIVDCPRVSHQSALAAIRVSAPEASFSLEQNSPRVRYSGPCPGSVAL
jgi:Mrp family chromosome partitioning ATPase